MEEFANSIEQDQNRNQQEELELGLDVLQQEY